MTIPYTPGERTWTHYRFNRSELRAILRWRAQGMTFQETGDALARFHHLTPRDRATAAYTGFNVAMNVLHHTPYAVTDLAAPSPGERTTPPPPPCACTDPTPTTPAPPTRPAAIRAAIACALTEYNRRMADINRSNQ